ncbi:MAG: (d)CMP kinase [Desulfohalobiaceae bacterium]|nr:(d)CMP kinase [Desulfohalobiaceae bacterium]
MADTLEIQKILKERTTSPQVITLDGAAGTGKTSLSRSLASLLGFNYLDTGAMYRSIALRLGEGAWLRSGPWLEEQLAELRFSLTGSGEETLLVLDGRPVGEEIRREEVGMWASKLAQLTVVREHLTRCQRDLGNSFSLVAEGRDMGTVVFPGAQFKYFLFADSEERARRRQRQIREEYGKEADLSEIRQDLEKRDRQDSGRSLAPLRAAEDAVSVDTTDKAFSQVLHLILEDMQSRLGAIQDPAHHRG